MKTYLEANRDKFTHDQLQEASNAWSSTQESNEPRDQSSKQGVRAFFNLAKRTQRGDLAALADGGLVATQSQSTIIKIHVPKKNQLPGLQEGTQIVGPTCTSLPSLP